MTFMGFPPEGIEFLRGLEAENSKTYFDKRRDVYEAALLEPAKDFVIDLGAELARRVSDGIRAEPKVNGSIFRINRDTRFSKDKRPYKTHLDLFFWEGDGRSRDRPGFFFRLAPGVVILGAGKHRFEGAALDAYREAVLADGTGEALEQALAATEEMGRIKVGGASLKRVPRGYDAAHPRAELLKHDGLYVWTESRTPSVVSSSRFVPWCAERFERLTPVHRWLVETFLP
jgi:uncharacterized protein (TIGR02453 family)